MAITTNTINGMTEISASSGKYLTQSYPTNFHEFYSKKMILPDDSVDNYKEVTETEKTQIETQDSKWEEPSKELIERWDDNWHLYYKSKPEFELGKYNSSTGFFEGNGLIDINTLNAKRILEIGFIHNSALTTGSNPNLYYTTPTLLPILGDIRENTAACVESTVIRVMSYRHVWNGFNPDTDPVNCDNSAFFGYISGRLREIKGVINLAQDTISGSSRQHFYNGLSTNLGGNLEKIYLINLFKGITLKHKNLNIECVDFMVENAKTVDTGQTITLHPNVYAKVSDELFGKASNKNITIATTE